MRIEGLQIRAFGHFRQVQFGPFSHRLTVIHGPNEAGKSTIHAFIRAMLFGFPAQPASGNDGGRLIVRDTSNQRYVIERFRDVNDGAAIVATGQGEPVGNDALTGLLANMTADLYQSVFAFSIDDLQSMESLPDEAVSGYLYASGLGVERMPRASAGFQRQAARLYMPDGSAQTIPELLRDLSAVERDLATARQIAEGYHRLEYRRRELDLDLQQAEYRLAAINQIEQRIADDQRRITRAKERLSVAERRLEEFERSIAESGSGSARSSADLRRSILELRESWTRLQATRRMTDVYQETVIRQRLPRSPWFLVALMLGILLPVVLGAITGQSVVIALGITSATLGIITLVIAAIARSRFETAQLQARLHLEMTHREAEGRFLHTAMATGIEPGNVEQEIERLEREQAASRASAPAPMTGHDREIFRDERRGAVAEAREAVAELNQELQDAWQDWHGTAAGLELPEEVREVPDQARAFIEDRRDALLVERGRLEVEIQQIEADRQSGRLRARREELLTRLREQTREWATLVIADRLLHDAAQAFEDRQQPGVLQEASDVFDAMTAGAYHRLVVPDGSEEIVALARDGREVTVTQMSRGTREQAYLALRIGLIRAIGPHERALPVLVDDILVNFDPERASEAMRALDGLSADHQVILFTCHPSTVALARFISPGARIISLGKQRITGLAPIWLDND